MSDSIFDELYASMKQAELITKGEAKAVSVTRYEIPDVKAIRSQGSVSKKKNNAPLHVSSEKP